MDKLTNLPVLKSVVGIGTDIVDARRIENSVSRWGDKFARKIVSDDERVELANPTSIASKLTRFFAAKEAVAKVLGTGIAEGVEFADIRVRDIDDAVPCVELFGLALIRANSMGIRNVWLSLSEAWPYTIAFAVGESGIRESA